MSSIISAQWLLWTKDGQWLNWEMTSFIWQFYDSLVNDAQCCHMGTSIKRLVLCKSGLSWHCNFWHPGTLMLILERHSAQKSKITNDSLTRSGTGCFIAVHLMATVGVKGLMSLRLRRRCVVSRARTPRVSNMSLTLSPTPTCRRLRSFTAALSQRCWRTWHPVIWLSVTADFASSSAYFSAYM